MSSEIQNRGVARVLNKLEASLESKNFYEAHQMYRTLFFRYSAQEKYDECLILLYKGATTLIKNEQYNSGADLILLIIETLEKSKYKEYKIWIEKIVSLIKIIPSNIIEREKIIVCAVRWSAKISKNQIGDPTLHKLIANIYWSEGNIQQARHHYLSAQDGSGFGMMLIQLQQTKGYDSEIDIFITQAILQQLLLKHKNEAVETFETYTKHHPNIASDKPPYSFPLLNFIYFLLNIIDAGKLDVFNTLCDLYKISLKRDPSYKDYLQKIAVIFFGEVQRPSSSIFGSLMSRIFEDIDDTQSTSTSTSTVANDLD